MLYSFTMKGKTVNPAGKYKGMGFLIHPCFHYRVIYEKSLFDIVRRNHAYDESSPDHYRILLSHRPERYRIANFIRNSAFVLDQALLKAETCHAERMIANVKQNFTSLGKHFFT